MRLCEDCPASIEGAHGNTVVCPACKKKRQTQSRKRYNQKPEVKQTNCERARVYMAKPGSKEKAKAHRDKPEVKQATKLRSQTPEARARKQEVNHRYNTKPEVREVYRLRSHEPEYRASQLEYNREYTKTPKGKSIRVAQSQKRRARIRSIPTTLIAAEVSQLRELPCHYCEREGGAIDHVIPITRGGQNTLSNCVPCCKSCNSSKGNKIGEEFEKWRLARKEKLGLLPP